MPPFLIALIIVVGGFWLIKKSSKMPSKMMPAFTQKLAGGAIMAFAILLLLRGDINAAMGLFVFGMGLYGKSALFPNGFNMKGQAQTSGPHSSAPPPPRPRGGMTRDEALQVLGLKPNANHEDVKLAHKRLIKDFHPDKGGSDYLAAKINEAKDTLLD
jgi:hypothetical protein